MLVLHLLSPLVKHLIQSNRAANYIYAQIKQLARSIGQQFTLWRHEKHHSLHRRFSERTDELFAFSRVDRSSQYL